MRLSKTLGTTAEIDAPSSTSTAKEIKQKGDVRIANISSRNGRTYASKAGARTRKVAIDDLLMAQAGTPIAQARGIRMLTMRNPRSLKTDRSWKSLSKKDRHFPTRMAFRRRRQLQQSWP